MEPRSGFVYERIPKSEVEELVLEEVPDIDYADIGGLSRQIEQIRDAVELPFLHADLFREHKLRPPKGILLYGPPGCGKTLIAKAVANSLAHKVAEMRDNGEDEQSESHARSYFLNGKGSELLNKYVGETERRGWLVFQRAREGQRRYAGHCLLRRDGLRVPYPRFRGQLRRRVRSSRSCSARSTASRAWRT
jgi:proteasome-associated ATPase